MKKKILIDLDVIIVAEWEKRDLRRNEALEFIKRVEEKEFYTYFLDEQLDSLAEWKYNELSDKVLEKIRKLKDEVVDVADIIEKLKRLIKGDIEEFFDQFMAYTKSKRADLRIVTIASLLKLDYLVTFNKKHLKSKVKPIEEFLKKHNLHVPKIVFPGEVPKKLSRVNPFSFSKPSHGKLISFIFDPFSKLIRSLKLSHTIKLNSGLFKVFDQAKK